MEQQKFYQKTWFIILLLILFFPVGLFLMWKYKPFNRPAHIVITVIIAALAVYGIANPPDLSSTTPEPTSAKVEAESTKEASNTEDANVEETEKAPPAEEKPAAPTASQGQTNALRSAKEYLSVMPFSYSGLIQQLEYEGYTSEEATYAADNCKADWNKQAEKAAKAYLDTMSFSRQGLIDQLIFEGYSQEQAEYGVSAAGY